MTANKPTFWGNILYWLLLPLLLLLSIPMGLLKERKK